MMGTSQRVAAKAYRPRHFLPPSELAVLRSKINSEEYLHSAIQRIALIMSNELLNIPKGEVFHERQRKEWK